MKVQREKQGRLIKAMAGLDRFSVALVALALSPAGCSFAFSRGPGNEYDEMGNIDCSGYTAPVLDTIWAGLNGLGAMSALSANDATWKQQNGGSDRSSVVASGMLWLAVSGMSAAYGYHNANACAEAKEEMLSGERRRHRPSRRERYPSPGLTTPTAPAPVAPRPPPPAASPTETQITDDDPFAAPASQ